MLKAITAPPGAGKSAYAQEQLVRELMLTDRPVITNVSVMLNPWMLGDEPQIGLIEYLRRIGYRGEPLEKRLRLLDGDEVKTFWRYRLNKVMPPAVVSDAGDVEFPWPNDGGVLYIIDELHDHFNAHEWAKVSKEAIFYLSKHRHIGDDIFGISQAMSNVAKQFRVLIQETILVRNLGMEKLGIFKLPARTLIRGYMYCPVTFKSETPMWSSITKFGRRGVRETYNTAGAVRGAMSSGDVGRVKTRGAPLWMLFAGAIAAFVGIWWASGAVPRYVLNDKRSKIQTNVPPRLSELSVVEASKPVSGSLLVENSESVGSVLTNEAVPLTMTGYVYVPPHGWMVTMSDGQLLRSWQKDFTTLEPKRVLIGNTWYPFAK